MTINDGIQGIEVLRAIAGYLTNRGARPYIYSLPFGEDNKPEEYKTADLNCICTHSDDGIYILAISEKEWWHVQCLGYAQGAFEVRMNDFNQAVSSAVSCYGHEKNGLPDEFQNARQFIGLSLPETPMYLDELKKRIGKPLRQKLNLWVFLYDSCSGSIKSIAPDSDY